MQIKRDFIFDPSLVLYLPLYQLDGSSFASRDAYGHLCTVTGAVWRPNGRYFDGTDDAIDIGNPTALRITGQITIEAWVKTPDNTRTWQGIVGKISGAGARSYAIAFLTNDAEVRISPDGTATVASTHSNVISNDTWYHLVGVADGANVTAYLNAGGATPAAVTSIFDSITDVRIGKTFAYYNAFQGDIGEVRIYNRALTPLEIQHNYLATKWRYQ